MITIISPAKALDFKSEIKLENYTSTTFQKESVQLINKLKKLKPAEIKQLMSLSDKLAQLNFERYHDWSKEFTLKNARQAILAFNGEVYNGLQAKTLKKDDIDYAQEKLRILSGLHGIIKPLDLIQPYRLEMGTKLKVGKKNNLYEFWGAKLNKALSAELSTHTEPVLINLASNEYSKAALLNKLKFKVITIDFKELKGEELKTITIYTKKARGLMTRFMITNRIDIADDLKHFDYEDYAYAENLSNDTKWVFTR